MPAWSLGAGSLDPIEVSFTPFEGPLADCTLRMVRLLGTPPRRDVAFLRLTMA